MRKLLSNLLPLATLIGAVVVGLFIVSRVNAAAPITTVADLPTGFVKCAAENGTCAISGTGLVTFGVSGAYVTPISATQSIPCTAAAFGGDPKPFVVKACYTLASVPSGPALRPTPSIPIASIPALSSIFTPCAVDGGTCKIDAPMLVVYGAPGGYTMPLATSQDMDCTISIFGGDPKPGAAKSCYFTPSNYPDGTAVELNPPAPIPPIDNHGFYVPSLLAGLNMPGAQFSFFAPQPSMCLDQPVYKTWTDPASNDLFKQGVCATAYGDFTFTRHWSVHPLVPGPSTWPAEAEAPAAPAPASAPASAAP